MAVASRSVQKTSPQKDDATRQAPEPPALAEAELGLLRHANPAAGLVLGRPARLHRQAGATERDPLGGTAVPAPIAGVLARRRSAGHPLPLDVAHRMGEQFDTDLSGVRVHADQEADRVARAVHSEAFTYGSDVYFTAGRYNPTSAAGQHLLAHELAHVVQGPGTTTASSPTIGRADDPAEHSADREASRVVSALRRQAVGSHQTVGVGSRPAEHGHVHPAGDDHTLRRHGSPEHLILGNLGPKDLRKIPDAKALLKEFGMGGMSGKANANKRAKVREAIHVVIQERIRLRQWQGGAGRGRAPETAKTIFGVEIVSLDNDTRNGAEEQTASVLVTYGELNTLADYFGSLEDLYAVSNEVMYKVLQTEREDYYNYLGQLFLEMTAEDYEVRSVPSDRIGEPDAEVKFYRSESWYEQNPNKIFGSSEGYEVSEMEHGVSSKLTGQDFEGTQSSLGKAGFASWIAGMHGIDTAVDADEGTKDQGTGGVWGATARNACHFAPQSWYAWKKYHQTARRLAGESYEMKSRGGKSADKAPAKANEAWLNNGFGDHYLQDSFAAGHLINKTLVMQWYLEFIDANWSFFGPGKQEWARLMQMTTEAQPGLAARHLYDKDVDETATGPQAIKPDFGAKRTWETADLTDIGLSPKAETLLRWWRGEIGRDPKRKTLTGSDLLGAPGSTKAAVDEVIALQMVVAKGNTWGSYVPYFGTQDKLYLLNETPGLKHDKAKKGTEQSASRTITYGAYSEFMKNALLQSGSGDLHNYFCLNGLDVQNDENRQVFRIYGDYVMMTAGGGAGVEISAATAQMSRQAISDILETGDTDISLEDIFARFPSKAALPDKIFDEEVDPVGKGAQVSRGGQFMLPLDKWHDELHPVLNKIFSKGSGALKDKMTWFASRVPTKSELTSLISVVPHGGDEF